MAIVCMDVGYTVVTSVGRVCSVKVRSEKNGVGETARSKRMNSTFFDDEAWLQTGDNNYCYQEVRISPRSGFTGNQSALPLWTG